MGLLEMDKLVEVKITMPPEFWLKHCVRCAKLGVDPEKQACEDLKELYEQL